MVGQTGAHQVTPASCQRVWRSQLEVAALDTAPGRLRLHAKHVLGAWSLAGLADTAELLVSELATNAVQAAQKGLALSRPAGPPPERPCVELRLTLTDYALVIEVWDGCPAPPRHTGLPDASRLGGRGLFLVQELSRHWGFYYPAPPGSRDIRDFDRFRPAHGPVPRELRPVTGKVVWCELPRPRNVPAAFHDGQRFPK